MKKYLILSQSTSLNMKYFKKLKISQNINSTAEWCLNGVAM